MGLPLKLVETEWADDDREVTFHFTADGRIDFRELVRDVAQRLCVHVTMHQISARDQAKRVPAYGPCGRPTCCSTFLREFEPVTIQMVKDQDLSLNSSRYSGLCGKLMCCLRYEHDGYQDAREAAVAGDGCDDALRTRESHGCQRASRAADGAA